MENMELDSHRTLLAQVNLLKKHQEELDELKGDKFNIFSILNVESAENKTHSAFIGELLNPAGSHSFGTKFLELFLELFIDQGAAEKFIGFDFEKTRLSLEYSIGKVQYGNDPSGGRIDIFITDETNSISIENKIYAGDQDGQVYRYVNYKKGNNLVFYLTLDGRVASEESARDSVVNEDYYCLSYQSHIVSWLELCQKEAFDVPTLRESIKQYLLLIKKLCGIMSQEVNNELMQLILKNYEAASLISENLIKAKSIIGEEIRLALIEKLSESLQKEYLIDKGKSNFTNQNNSYFWIRPKLPKIEDVYFALQSFTSNGNIDNGNLFVGILSKNENFSQIQGAERRISKWWLDIKTIVWEGAPVNFNDPLLLMAIVKDEELKRVLIESIEQQVTSFISQKESLIRFLD